MAVSFDLSQEYSGVSKVVILVMGGSAISGDLVSSLVASEVKLPGLVQRDYNLPAFVEVRLRLLSPATQG